MVRGQVLHQDKEPCRGSVSAGMPEKKASNAASPPADAPMPTTGKAVERTAVSASVTGPGGAGPAAFCARRLIDPTPPLPMLAACKQDATSAGHSPPRSPYPARFRASLTTPRRRQHRAEQQVAPEVPARTDEGSRRAQAGQLGGRGADAEDDLVLLVALLQHLAVLEDLAAQLLAVVGDAQLLLDQVAGEEVDQRSGAGGRRPRGGARTSPAPRASGRRGARAGVGLVADAVDLVEHQQARHVAGADLAPAPPR